MQHQMVLTFILLRCWRADGIAIVAANEEAGCFQSGSKVQGSMEVSFTGGPFSKVGHSHSGRLLQLKASTTRGRKWAAVSSAGVAHYSWNR